MSRLKRQILALSLLLLAGQGAMAMSCEEAVGAKPESISELDGKIAAKEAELDAAQAHRARVSDQIREEMKSWPKDLAAGEVMRRRTALQEELGIQELVDRLAMLKSEIEYLRHVQQARQRKNSGAPMEAVDLEARFLRVDVRLNTKNVTPSNLRYEISIMIREAGFDPDQIFIRFFASPREDLVRMSGTDREGTRLDYEASDVFGAAAAMEAAGLPWADGLFLCPLDEAFGVGHEPNQYFREFLAGWRSIAIYDARFIAEAFGDYYAFKNPSRKRQALIGIVAPAHQPYRP